MSNLVLTYWEQSSKSQPSEEGISRTRFLEESKNIERAIVRLGAFTAGALGDGTVLDSLNEPFNQFNKEFLLYVGAFRGLMVKHDGKYVRRELEKLGKRVVSLSLCLTSCRSLGP